MPRDAGRAAWCSNRNPDNFFAETEQVAFCAAHIVPGHRLLATTRCSPGASTPTSTRRSRGSAARTSTRSRSTRRSRRCTTTSATACIARRSTAAAWPTSPTRSAAAARSRPARRGFTSLSRSRSTSDKVRGKPEKFADHYTQATLFCEQPDAGARRRTSSRAFRFELTKVQVPGDPRAHGVACCANVDDELAAAGRRRPRHRRCREPHAAGAAKRRKPEVDGVAGAVAASARPGDGSIRTRQGRDPGAPTASTARRCEALHAALADAGAVPRFVGAAARARSRRPTATTLEADATLETMPVGAVRRRGACPTARRRSTALGALGHARRVRQGPVPPLQADPRARRQARRWSMRLAIPPATLPSGKRRSGRRAARSRAIDRASAVRRCSRAPSPLRARDRSAGGLEVARCRLRHRRPGRPRRRGRAR